MTRSWLARCWRIVRRQWKIPFETAATYEFNTRTVKHRFCRHCGIHPFCVPRSDPDKMDVNVRCLDGVDIESIATQDFDGRHWETAIESASWKQ